MYKSLYKRVFWLVFASALYGAAGRLEATPPAGYSLVWSDEFNGTLGSAPNSANWTYDTGDSGWGNSELENYTTSTANSQIVADPSDSAPTDGSYLGIIAIDTTPGSSNYSTVGRYTSARLNSSGLQSFQYGWMEARIKAPTGQGTWPAFWMLGTNIGSVGWPTCGETDIMEQVGDACCLGTNYGSLHSPGYNTSNNQYHLPGGQDFYTDYHTFSVLWQQDSIQFYVDNILYETPSNQTAAYVASQGGTWEFNNTFFFLLNQAVGGTFPGNPSAAASFPQTMFVDYVRVYQPNTPTPTGTPTITFTATPTASATNTPTGLPTGTSTSTATVTNTPTVTATSLPSAGLYVPYPNPAVTGLNFDYTASGPSQLKVTLYTVAYRKVFQDVVQVGTSGTYHWDLRDRTGMTVANGLYYLKVDMTGSQASSKVMKVLVLR